MNMLTGMLCEQVSQKGEQDHEHRQVEAVMEFIKLIDDDCSGKISRQEFCESIDKPDAIKKLLDLNVDVEAFVESADSIFEEFARNKTRKGRGGGETSDFDCDELSP